MTRSNPLEDVIVRYCENVRSELQRRWESWDLDLDRRYFHEAVGALLARQVTLATQIAMSPGVWNGHVAPVLLRSMADVYIALSWILKDPDDRAKRFVYYGIGQEKLEVEHRKSRLDPSADNAEQERLIAAKEAWINGQRWTWLTEVDLGSWSGTSTRKMAEEADCLDFYNLVYTPFSAATHSMWHHISRFNLRPCVNPLHGGHYEPIDPDMEADSFYVCLGAKYVEKAFAKFDEAAGLPSPESSAFESLLQELKELREASEDEEEHEEPGSDREES